MRSVLIMLAVLPGSVAADPRPHVDLELGVALGPLDRDTAPVTYEQTGFGAALAVAGGVGLELDEHHAVLVRGRLAKAHAFSHLAIGLELIHRFDARLSASVGLGGARVGGVGGHDDPLVDHPVGRGPAVWVGGSYRLWGPIAASASVTTGIAYLEPDYFAERDWHADTVFVLALSADFSTLW